jgi:protocatechuate 3,4-dioxygenase beta subunit
MPRTTRRRFLERSLLAPALLLARPFLGAGQRGLDQFVLPAPSCTDTRVPTPAVGEAHDFMPGSPERSSLADRGTVGTKLILTGSVIGLTCGPVKGAILDVWQADASGRYDDKGFFLRGHQLTDAQGRYHFETVVPGAFGNRARHLDVRVQAPGKPILATQLFFPGERLNARDPYFRPELVVKMTGENDAKTAVFDFILNI